MQRYLDTYFSEGPSPKFTPYHIWKTFKLIQIKGPISRKTLAETLGLGEGSVRTILTKMTKEGIIESSHQGVSLTPRGQLTLERMGIEVSSVNLPGCLSRWNGCSVLVPNTAHILNSGKNYEDDVVKAGAEMGMVVVRKEAHLFAIGEGRRLQGDEVEAIESSFQVGIDDVVVIGLAPNYHNAEKGAVSAALALCQQSSQCWSDGPCIITKDTGPDELECIALAMHEIIGKMPLGIRSKNKPGIRCEDGYVIDKSFTGPNLEEALATGKTIRRVSNSGPYAGAPVVVVPIIKDGEPIAAIGVVDFTQLSIYDILGRIRRTRSINQ